MVLLDSFTTIPREDYLISIENLQFGNGAGSVKTLDDVRRASRGPMTRITVGSITRSPRTGNIGETYYFHPQDRWSLNTLGLPNIGIEGYGPLWRNMLAMAQVNGKKLWASISPFSAEECAEMTDRLLCAGIDGVEINGSCPNVWKGNERKSIPALDPPTAAEMFRQTKAKIGNFNQVSFKLSPTRDTELLARLAVVLREHQVEQLVCCNTKPDQEGVRVNGKPALAFRTDEQDTQVKHKGGLAGAAVIDDGVFVAKEMLRLMPHAEVLGCGGIFYGPDAQRYLDAGCLGFQCTTGYLEYKERVFGDILMSLELAA